MELEIGLPAGSGRLEKGLYYVDGLLTKLGRSLVEAESDIDHVTVLVRVDFKKHHRRHPKRLSYSLKNGL